MITFTMNLRPYGVGAGVGVISAQIWTTADGLSHDYSIDDTNMNMLATGSIPKDRSGHRNPLHLLAAIIDDIDLDSLGRDYVITDADHVD